MLVRNGGIACEQLKLVCFEDAYTSDRMAAEIDVAVHFLMRRLALSEEGTNVVTKGVWGLGRRFLIRLLVFIELVEVPTDPR